MTPLKCPKKIVHCKEEKGKRKMQVENPITKTRQGLGLTRRDLAIASGVPYAEVWKAEAGYCSHLNRRLADYLERTGLMREPQERYTVWRSEEAEALTRKSQEANDGEPGRSKPAGNNS